ncbi:MAG: hypothetical protein CM15mP103_05720 [Gammaproteobacteria bacterium]|nr:MAG: hypothetical protein CM15mP103_05720 [Gammaproteobacteria bacterium]
MIPFARNWWSTRSTWERCCNDSRDQCDGEGPEPVADGPFLLEPSEGTPYCNRRWLGLFPARRAVYAAALGTLRVLTCRPAMWTGRCRWAPRGIWRPGRFGTFRAPQSRWPGSTASGLTFIGATTDHFLRAFDTDTGEELWKGRLPTSGHGLPITYQLSESGKQYVVIAAVVTPHGHPQATT